MVRSLKKGEEWIQKFSTQINHFPDSRVVLENCIICDKAVVKKGSVLKNCLVGFNYTVEEETVKDKAHLTGEGFMEIE